MSLDISLYCKCCGTEFYDLNITHNLNRMADEAGIYLAMWRPEEINAEIAKDIILYLKKGIRKLKNNPEIFKKLNPINGWSSYETLLLDSKEYFRDCCQNPNAIIKAHR